MIDLARVLRKRIDDPRKIASVVIYTSHHTHYVIGSGSGDPQKYDPNTSRETLDHSLPYIFAVALEDGEWHHVRSYERARATRPETVAIWNKITTVEDPEWTRRYHNPDPSKRAFGGQVEVRLDDGEVITEELMVAGAHPAGARPFGRAQYVEKFGTLTEGVLSDEAREAFLAAAGRLADLSPDELARLTLPVDSPEASTPETPWIF